MMFSVVIPTLNERTHIGSLIEALLADAGPELIEIIVADGGSTDGTLDIVASHAVADRRVKLLPNPKRLQSAAMNLAEERADPRATILVRLDAHALYPAGFAGAAARALVEKAADSVVVRLCSRGEGCFQQATAAAGNSVLGTGGSVHRVGGASRWIDHGHHAAFRRETFHHLGGYDESFPANEDAEYDVRLRRAGGRIWFEANLAVTYFPRRTPVALARQYYRYGAGRARNYRKHDERLRLRQVAAPILLVVVALSLLAAPFTVGWSLLGVGAYAAACLAASLSLALRKRNPCLLGVALALPVMHFAWGAGFLLVLANGRKLAASATTSQYRPNEK